MAKAKKSTISSHVQTYARGPGRRTDDEIRLRIRRAIGDVIDAADGIRFSAIALEDVAGELAGDSSADEIRKVAGSIRSSALSLLLAAAALTSKAERLETYAEVRELGESAEAG
jgi:hypothetical protein